MRRHLLSVDDLAREDIERVLELDGEDAVTISELQEAVQ